MSNTRISPVQRCFVATTVMCLSLLMVATLGANLHALGLTPHQEAINQAIEDGCAYLEGTQIQYSASGTDYGYWDPGWGSSSYVAGTGMALLALVSNFDTTGAASYDCVVEDEYIRRSVNYLLATQLGNGTWGGNITYQVSAGVWGLAAVRDKLGAFAPGSPSIAPIVSAIEAAKNWIIASQWDESCLWGSVPPTNTQYYGGFGYGSHSRPDLSNSQFALVALRAALVAETSNAWDKGAMYVEQCQYKFHADGGMWYTPDGYVWGFGSTGAMTAAGVWSYALCGVPLADSKVQDALSWLSSNYMYIQNPNANPVLRSHYYYLWGAAKGFLVYDLTHGEIGGTIPVDPLDASAFIQGWYYDFSKYLVAQQQPNGSWVSGSYNGGHILDTEYALFILGKETGIPFSVLVSIAPDEVIVDAGDDANFNVSVENIGTQQDSYDMDVMYLPGDFAWTLQDPVIDVAPEATAVLPLVISTPSDLAIWVETPFDFDVQATSLSDPGISHATSGTVRILAQPTPISRLHYVDELLEALMAEVAAADIPQDVEDGLLDKLNAAEKKKHQGLAHLEAGREHVAANMFHAAALIMQGFMLQVVADALVGETDKVSFIAQAEDIVWRLEEGILGESALALKAMNFLPSSFHLSQNYPNPFNPVTNISFSLPAAAGVSLEIFNMVGQKVATLVDRHYEAGHYTVTWDGSRSASGVYLYRLTTGELVETKKMVLLK